MKLVSSKTVIWTGCVQRRREVQTQDPVDSCPSDKEAHTEKWFGKGNCEAGAETRPEIDSPSKQLFHVSDLGEEKHMQERVGPSSEELPILEEKDIQNCWKNTSANYNCDERPETEGRTQRSFCLCPQLWTLESAPAPFPLRLFSDTGLSPLSQNTYSSREKQPQGF